MKRLLTAGSILLCSAPVIWAQDASEHSDFDEVIIADPRYFFDDFVVAKGVRRETAKQVETIDVILPTGPDGLSLAHPAEVLNTVAGVNIHRGSGQEHLTAIRSPVLTGGAGAGSFLYTLDGVPLRAAGFANVNGLLEAPTEVASRIEVFKGPGPADFGSNAVHGLINVVLGMPGYDGQFVSIQGSMTTAM